MPDVAIYHGTAAERLAKLEALMLGSFGVTTDEFEAFFANPASAIGVPAASPQVPQQGLDVRRLFGFASQGQADTWTGIDSVVYDASGMVLSPRPHAAVSLAGTDVVSTGRIMANELADGGKIVIEAVGTWISGSITPRILANLKIGGTYVYPQYEQYVPSVGPATPVDLASLAGSANNTRPFEWSAVTIGLNALGGYEALNVAAANLTPGEITWKLTMTVHALGRWAKWQRFNNSGTGAASTKDRNCWVEATLEFGALHHNVGARSGHGFGYANPTGPPSVQYNATLPNGTARGCIYTFLGTQWLCHAGSATNALDAAADPDTLDATIWGQMLMEEAPGMGAHWREFWVPAVTRATISGYSTVDWTVDNEIQLELGGPQQVDLGTSFPAYSAVTSYLPESTTHLCSDAGVNYVAKTVMLAATFPRFVAGVSDTTGVTPTFTAPPTGDPNSNRCWRALPATMRDEMRVQHAHAYLFGRRNGAAERRI